nr:uncharacterized protein LOC111514645 [Leptinotarsa decemlineata]
MNLTLNENISKTYFYETYHWLIMSLSRDISHIFEPLKLSINSDVHLVIPNEKENFSIFDVYNPASEHGGIVKVIFLGMYNKAVGYMAKYSGNKYWERRNMTGVNFKSAIVIPNLTMPLETYLASDEDRQINSMHRFQMMALFPQTTCFYKALVNKPPATLIDEYELLFEDPTYQEGYSPPHYVVQRYVIAYKQKNKQNTAT